ncbi:MAG: hypothetical protein ACUVSK_06725, partial [Desulfotomaculales bacterium]
ALDSPARLFSRCRTMMISGLLPALLNILSLRPLAEGPPEGEKSAARPAQTGIPAAVASAAGKEESGPAAPPGKDPVAGGTPGLTLVIPLLFKEPSSYPEAGLYLVLDRRKLRGAGENDGLDFLLVVSTGSLGTIRLFLKHQQDSLRLSWLLPSEEAKKRLEEDFPALERELSGAGYKNILINSRVLPEDGNESPPRRGAGTAAPFDSFDSYV